MATRVTRHGSQIPDEYFISGASRAETSKGYVYLLLRVERSDVNQITEALTQTPNH